jgi:putative phosphoribosyl transferase
MPSRKVLCMSFDRVVRSRCSSLKEAGYDVTARTNINDGLDLLNRDKLDAVTIGHRFSAKEKYLLAVQAKEKANTPVVLVCGATPESEIPATTRVYALEGNTGLVSALCRLCPRGGSPAASGSLSRRDGDPNCGVYQRSWVERRREQRFPMLFREEDEDLDALPFTDRAEAGRMLASKLSAYCGRRDVIVLALPRGGVPVASAVAEVLHVSLDVFLVSKIGTPWNRELAMGAAAESGVQVLNLSLVKLLSISEEHVQEVAAGARRELESRARLYRGGRPLPDLEGRTVILVDDGIATGCSILAAIVAIRRKNAARVVVAVPVAAASGCSAIRMEADEVISVAEPEMFLSVSQWYEDFSQISDEDVCRLLKRPQDPAPRAA